MFPAGQRIQGVPDELDRRRLPSPASPDDRVQPRTKCDPQVIQKAADDVPKFNALGWRLPSHESLQKCVRSLTRRDKRL
jgi:hypothetical protein